MNTTSQIKAPVSRLYAVRQNSTGYWWQCNTDHGAGWTEHIEQAWTRRKALEEVARLAHHEWEMIDGCTLVSLQPRKP